MHRTYCRPLTLIAALLISEAPGAFAQTTEEAELALAYGDKSFVSIATGSKQPLRQAPAVATVITAEDIAAMGATDLDEVLETVPGLHVSRTAVSYTPLYVIRGIYSNPSNPQILMLQNGIPVTTVYTGDKGVVWAGYPLEHVSRIEIIRGPGSALYGADAFAGVINIITKTAEDAPGTELGARGGTFNTWDAWVHHGGSLGPVKVAAYLRAGQTDGSEEVVSADAQTFFDGLFGTSASLAPGPVSTGRDALDANLDLNYDKWRWRSNYKLRENVGTGAGVASALDPDSTLESERITTDLSWTDPQLGQNWGAGFVASYLYYEETSPDGLVLFPPGADFPTPGSFPNGVLGGPNRWERQVRLSTYLTYSGFEGHALRIGIGHDDLDLYRTSTYKNFLLGPGGLPIPTGPVIEYSAIQPHILPQRRKNDYVYAQDEWRFAPDWALTAGVRHDDYSDFGDTTNPRLALVWDVAYDLTAKLLYGEAFRAPSFNEQYGINPVANGNRNLKPETIKTLEAAFSWQARHDTQVNLSFFYYVMKDIIRTVSNAPSPGSTFNNTGDQNGRGMELEAVWDYDRSLRLSGNYAYQRSIDEATDHDAGNAPHHHLFGRVDWRFASGWLASGQANYIGSRKRISGDTRPEVPDYTTVDVAVQRLSKREHWNFMLAVHNLFDEDVREPTAAPGLIPNDLPLPGRWYLLQARYQL